MSTVVIALWFLGAFLLTVTQGAGIAFSLAYLPGLLLLSVVTPEYLPVLFRIDPAVAALYGILIGSLLTGRLPRFRITLIDVLLLLILLAHSASTLQTERLRLGIDVIFKNGIEQGIFVYFIARGWFRGRLTDRRALEALPVCMGVVLLFGLIEARLWPHTYELVLQALGLTQVTDLMTLSRLGFFRAQASFAHPIDLGLGAGLAGATYAILVWRSGLRLNTTFRAWILGGWLLASVVALSFTSLAGLACAIAFYAALRASPISRPLLPVVIVLVIVAGFVFAEQTANAPLVEKKQNETPLEGSLRNRQELLYYEWKTAQTAGWLGWGARLEEHVTRSIDNAYLLAAMRRGWISLILWLAIPIVLAVMIARCPGSPRGSPHLRTAMLGASAVFGTMIAMFTVFFGFVYAQLFMLVLALTVDETLAARSAAGQKRRRRHVRRESARRVAPASGATQHAFER